MTPEEQYRKAVELRAQDMPITEAEGDLAQQLGTSPTVENAKQIASGLAKQHYREGEGSISGLRISRRVYDGAQEFLEEEPSLLKRIVNRLTGK